MDSELYDAVIKDKIDVYKDMQTKLKVRDQLTPTNSTALHLACQYGSINCAKEILRVHESLLLQINSDDETALHLAARYGHYEVVLLLINTAKSLFIKPNHIRNSSSTVVQDLIRKPNLELETALHAAARYNHNNVVHLLVSEDPSHSYPQNKHNETPLYLASIRYYTCIIRTLLDNCVSPTFGGPDGRTALHAAVLDNGGDECVKLLLERDTNLVKVADNYGWTAYHYVAYNNLYKIVKDLVGADKSVGYLVDTDYKRTALHLASYRGNVRVMKELLKYFPDCWEIVDGAGRNIFHIAVEQNRKEVMRFILSRGFVASNTLLTKRDREGNTPLHLISKFGCYVQQLMDLKKLDWEVLNNQSLTPLDVVHSQQKADNTPVDQALVSRTLIHANVKKHWHLWPTQKEPDVETGKNDFNRRQVEEYNKKYNSHMIVAALIATVALTAGFAMPGGFDGNQGPNQGSAVLLRETAFKVFMVTDAIALLFSVSSLFLYFVTALYKDARRVRTFVVVSALLNILSVVAMMMAFITGTHAVLAHSSSLAISVCVISSLFFFLVCYTIAYIFRGSTLVSALLMLFVFVTKI